MNILPTESSSLLLVDDDDFVRTLLKDILLEEALAVRILEAEDGDKALALAERERPNVMLLDLFMPHRSGLDVLNAVREASPETRVLVISSMDVDPIVTQALEAGAVGFVGKPFHPMEVATAVRKALAP